MQRKCTHKNVTPLNLHKWSYLQKINYVWIEKVRSIAQLALDRSALNREGCARSLVTAPISHGATMKVMATTVMRIFWVYVEELDRDVCARSRVCAIDCTNRGSLLLLHLLQHFDGKDLQQKKTLKEAKILENNKAKGLTNIN